ncbi:MAG: protein-tyrosine kinase [Lachnospiraceae bacterium]|nr:protein-tyrosine kinase [Lachnospiraceae bacterium]
MNENKKDDVLEIDLWEIVLVLMSKLWIIVLCAVIVGGACFAVAKFAITPTYNSTTRIVILNKSDQSRNLTYSDVQMGTQLTKDYTELITSRYVVERVIDTFNLNKSYSGIIKDLKVENPTGTRILNITYTDTNPERAKEIVDEIRNEAKLRIEEVMDIEAVNLVDEGNVPTKPSAPSKKKWTLIGAFLGGAFAAFVIILRYMMDDTIKLSEDVERHLGLSTLAIIPYSEEENDGENDSAGIIRRKKRQVAHTSSSSSSSFDSNAGVN